MEASFWGLKNKPFLSTPSLYLLDQGKKERLKSTPDDDSPYILPDLIESELGGTFVLPLINMVQNVGVPDLTRPKNDLDFYTGCAELFEREDVLFYRFENIEEIKTKFSKNTTDLIQKILDRVPEWNPEQPTLMAKGPRAILGINNGYSIFNSEMTYSADGSGYHAIVILAKRSVNGSEFLVGTDPYVKDLILIPRSEANKFIFNPTAEVALVFVRGAQGFSNKSSLQAYREACLKMPFLWMVHRSEVRHARECISSNDCKDPNAKAIMKSWDEEAETKFRLKEEKYFKDAEYVLNFTGNYWKGKTEYSFEDISPNVFKTYFFQFGIRRFIFEFLCLQNRSLYTSISIPENPGPRHGEECARYVMSLLEYDKSELRTDDYSQDDIQAYFSRYMGTLSSIYVFTKITDARDLLDILSNIQEADIGRYPNLIKLLENSSEYQTKFFSKYSPFCSDNEQRKAIITNLIRLYGPSVQSRLGGLVKLCPK